MYTYIVIIFQIYFLDVLVLYFCNRLKVIIKSPRNFVCYKISEQLIVISMQNQNVKRNRVSVFLNPSLRADLHINQPFILNTNNSEASSIGKACANRKFFLASVTLKSNALFFYWTSSSLLMWFSISHSDKYKQYKNN